jgi:hypothetical protein
MGCVHKHPSLRTRRAKRPFSKAAFGFKELSEMTSLKSFVTSFAGHIAGAAAANPGS